MALTVLLGDLHVVAAVVLLAVEVGVERDALRLARLQEHLVERTRAPQVGHVQRTVDAVERGVAVDGVGLGPLEVGEHVVVPPARVAQSGPAVVVRAVPPRVDHGVDGAGAPQRLAAGLEAPSSVEPGLGHGLVAPAVAAERHAHREAQRGADQQVPPLAARLEQAHRHRRVLAQPAGHHAAGRSSSDHHVVERVPDLVHRRTVPRRPSATGRSAVGVGVDGGDQPQGAGATGRRIVPAGVEPAGRPGPSRWYAV